LIKEFARTAVVKLDISTLLLDASSKAGQSSFFGVKPESGWEDVVLENKPFKDVVYQVGDTRLFISRVAVDVDSLTSIIESPKISEFLEQMKKDFDLILIDTPPASVSTNALSLSNKVSGSVLVVENEKTRWQVANAVKENIIKRGGKILGVVINKRKYYIPKFIYKRL
jgi:Mrp family chromosome partitioning ATPase